LLDFIPIRFETTGS